MRALRFASVYWRAAAGAVYALTLGIHKRKHRALLTNIARHFGYDYQQVKPVLPLVRIDDIRSPGSHPDLRELDAVDGNVTVLELVVIASITAQLAPHAVFEIGTFDGRTTVNLAANAAPDAIVSTLDLPPVSETTALDVHVEDRKYLPSARSGSRIAASELVSQIRRVFGDSATFDFTPYHDAIDLCFVDGAHTYDYVINDSARALEIVRPNGVVLWHDYGMWPGVTEALNELVLTNPAFSSLVWIEGTTLAMLRVGAVKS
jgi:predicted O-methyltransferase YrrM